MYREIKYELYKLFRERFLWGTFLIICIVSFVMTSGAEITLENLLQKSFLPEVIASLYAAFFVARDLENKSIIYPVLAGQSRFKIIISQFVAVVLATEILNLIFPLLEIIPQSEWMLEDKIVIIANYMVLGVFLASLGLFMAWTFEKTGVAIIGGIVFHIFSLFLMNNKVLSEIAMKIFPVGITKLLIEEKVAGYWCMSPWIWTLGLLFLAIIISKNIDL